MAITSSNGISPKVSIIVPNYNHSRFLEQRFSSIFQQTYQDFEIIFLDDASSDNSLEIFAGVAKHPKIVRSILNEKNTGSPYLQWNRGARAARGDYIWIAESDDYAHPLFLESMVALLDKNPSVGIAFCQSMKVDELSNVIGTTEEWTSELGAEQWSNDFVANGRGECGDFLIRKCVIPNVSSALIRRDVLVRVGYAHEAMRYCGDYFTYAKMLEKSDLAYVATPLNFFRFSANTMRVKMTHSWLHEYERAEVMAYVNEVFAISEGVRERSARIFVEKLLRLSFNNWRFGLAWLSRFGRFRVIASKFSSNFGLLVLSTTLRMAGRLAKGKLLSWR